MREPLRAFLPCRAGSERVPRKNTRVFGDEQAGLLGIKLRQLARCPSIQEIVLSTNDPEVMELSRRVDIAQEKLRIVERAAHLARSETSTDALIAHVSDMIADGTVLWTHVTSPFVDEGIYQEAIETYIHKVDSGEFDSLMSVLRRRTFFWDESGPINYDRSVEKWPRTQLLPAWYEINSAIFLAPLDVYRNLGDRVGRNPVLFELDPLQSLDIDWEEDFELASRLWRAGIRGR